ncbi:MAG: nicotinate-nucleotide adenylyltransferase [Bacteroidales bacterium]|nr:nicotinate-nucleotide adenylyltransferase [Bacteroidales bacterium]
MKTGLFFGSFNPIHNGHLSIAKHIVDFTEVNELWFVVSPQNPLKEKDILAPDYHRLEMVKRAIPLNEHRMFVCDIEMNMPKPSYTIDTLRTLRLKYPDKEFIIILGSDSLESITKWKEYNALINDYKIFIYPRKGSNMNELTSIYPVKKISAPLVNFSSTSVREKLISGEDVSMYIPEDVLEYINKMRLYKTK